MDAELKELAQRHGLDPRGDVWELPQRKGTWIIKHKALEKIAAKEGITFSMPQVVESNTAEGTIVLVVEGRLGDRTEWATGEASKDNNKNNYPAAMAEKRAKDRVILKLCGLHGLAYSEDESNFEEQRQQLSAARGKLILNYEAMTDEIDKATPKQIPVLLDFYTNAYWLPSGWAGKFRERLDARVSELESFEEANEDAERGRSAELMGEG